jgi:hypothetical protein
MLNYLLVIHPIHKDAIRTVDLSLSLSSTPKAFEALAFATLASMPNLRHLTVRVTLQDGLFDPTLIYPYLNNPHHSAQVLSLKQKVLDRLVTAEELIGNGLRDEEGGKGGIRNLLSLNFRLRTYGIFNLKNGEREKWASVETALRAVMVKST